mmetsp:Transcript_20623/g.60935  ORF Transcript_20623/g.60935 Transcript_20623/m.60935 type:complete len:230 (+) Transcript_20623:906-1595(+)
MPTPTSASWIMDTSLAPSPMARVMGVGLTCSLTNRMARAFCRGLTRQTTTAEHWWDMCTSLRCSDTSSKMMARDRPSMTMAQRRLRVRSARRYWSSSLRRARILCESLLAKDWAEWALSSARSTGSPSGKATTRRGLSWAMRLAAVATLMAVSILSPVSIHTCMPPFCRAEMVLGTPSCSRSSMAEAPTSWRPTSRRAATASRASSRRSARTLASLYSASHAVAAASEG